MKKTAKIVVALVLSCALTGCSGVSQSDYDNLSAEKQLVESELSAQQTENTSLQTETNDLKSKYERLKSEKDKIQADYDEILSNFEDWKTLTDNEKAARIEMSKHNDEIAKLKSDAKIKQNEIAELEADIEKLKSDIEKYEGELIKAKGSPISLPAGYLTAGTDFDVGRYKVYGGSSNFVVYDSRGDLRVNIILSPYDDGFGVTEYIYKFSLGDTVEARSAFKMVPVE